MINQVIDYITANIIELAGFLFGIIYVLLAIRQNIWCWIAGIINVTMYIIVFFDAKLFGDMVLQIFYLLMSFYGLYNWLGTKNKQGKKVELPVSRISKKQIFFSTSFVIVMTLIGGTILSYTDDPIPYTDGFTTALGLIATWMTAKKLIENWWVWVFTNLLCVGVYWYKELYPTSIYFLLLAAFAVAGYYQWKKDLTPAHA